jgi:hypothetical protein
LAEALGIRARQHAEAMRAGMKDCKFNLPRMAFDRADCATGQHE